jgi:hypothetical protein
MPGTVVAFGERNGRFADSRTELAPTLVEIVGKSAARLKRTWARASRSLASAIFRVWLAGAICASSASRSGSRKMVHHWPRGR